MAELSDSKVAAQASSQGAPFDAHALLQEGSKMVRTKSWKAFAYVIPDPEYGTGFFVDSADKDRCVVAADTHQVHAFPSVTMSDGKSYWAHVIHKNEKDEMTYLEIEGVADPKTTCKGVKLSQAQDDFSSKRDVGLVGYPHSSDGEQRALTGESLPAGTRYGLFSGGLFEDKVKIRVAGFHIEGGEPGISGAPIFDRKTGEAIAVAAGGKKGLVYGKPIADVVSDVAAIPKKQP